MAYCTGRCMCHGMLRGNFEADDVAGMVHRLFEGRVEFHDGDCELAPGITLHKLGGHTKGLQVARVNTARGPVVLASDATHLYANLERDHPFPVLVDVEGVSGGAEHPAKAGALARPHHPRPRPEGVGDLPRRQAGAGRDRAGGRRAHHERLIMRRIPLLTALLLELRRDRCRQRRMDRNLGLFAHRALAGPRAFPGQPEL